MCNFLLYIYKLPLQIPSELHSEKYKLLCPRETQTCALAVANIKVNGNGKVILDTHPESDQHQIWWVGAGGEPLEQVQFWC